MAAEDKADNAASAGSSRKFRLWVGMQLPPLAWAAYMQTIYLTSEWACHANDLTWNHISAAIAFVLSAGGFFIAYAAWRAAGGGTEDEGDGGDSRAQFMALLGIATGVLFTLLIFAQWLPSLMRVPCGK
jgi:hypothetical protein